MKALTYLGPKKIKFGEIPVPKIKPDEVLMQIKSVGICGTDLHIYNGGMNIPTPLTIGHEFSGIVAEVGSSVKHLKTGQKVVAEHVISCGQCGFCLQGKPNLCLNAKVIGLHRPGALAEYVAVPASLVFSFPDTLSFDEAALVEPLSIAYYAVREAGFLLGSTVAVVGQGPIGLLANQVLKLAGAQVIGIDINDHRLKFAKRKKWVDHTINSKTQNVAQKIKKITGSACGVDATFEVVGVEATAEMSLEITRRDGKVFLLGVFESPSKINLMHLVKKELNVYGSWTCAHSFPQSIQLAASGKIDLKSIITHKYPAKDGVKAFRQAAKYSDNRIKTVINFGS